MRRASYTPLSSQCPSEPLIVVEETGGTDEEGSNRSARSSPRHSEDVDSPMHNPYLLSPWRDPRETRKHSLPTPACTSGITASQVRRLSERGGEGSGPSPREQAFLATLYSAPAPTGRRHSVVTISKVPPTLFGRNRRESIAAFPTISGASSRAILATRRESTSSVMGPPSSSDHRGSVHNLQLDIMDDIVTARKVRMKMWNTSSERVCEVQPLDEAGPSTSPLRYTQQASGTTPRDARRYSDFVGTTLPVVATTKRRASEFPGLPVVPPRKPPAAGIVCSNTDLISILSSLTSSATEINQCGVGGKTDAAPKGTHADQKRNRMRTSRSNSFDVSILQATTQDDSNASADTSDGTASSWFIKRHQPMSVKDVSDAREPAVTFLQEEAAADTRDAKQANKVVWDGKSGSLVDAEALGSAIEVFLRRGAGAESPSSPPAAPVAAAAAAIAPPRGAVPKTAPKAGAKAPPPPPPAKNSSWFSGKGGDEDATETCDTSICSTLKDLFVK